MSERTLYITYSVQSGSNTGVGRNTVTLSSKGALPDLLSMADIRRIEEDNLRIVRETMPEVTALHITWWTEIRPEVSSPAPTEEG